MEAIFRSVFDFIHSFVDNYGVSVILFTVFIRFIQMPFDYKSRQSMRKMEKINPKIQALQKKYANDQEKLQKKQAELYRKEKINPLSGCLPMLITLPIMFIMLGVLRHVADEQLVKALLSVQRAVGDLGIQDADAISAALPSKESLMYPFLWIKNLWMPDSPFSTILPTNSSVLATVRNGIEGLITPEGIASLQAFVDGEIYQNIIVPSYDLSVLKGANINLLIINWQVYMQPNGYLVLPILSFVTQVLSSQIMTKQQKASGQTQNQAGGGMMKWGMPIIFAIFCVSYTASFALYLVVSGVLQVAQTQFFNWYLNAQDKKAAALTEEVDKL